jgi:hypothetical protein
MFSLPLDALEIKQKQSPCVDAQTGMHTRIFCVAIMRSERKKKEKCALRDEKEREKISLKMCIDDDVKICIKIP